MTKKYSRWDLSRMNVGELSQLIGYDYREFIDAGGTDSDVLAIANGKKSLYDVIPELEQGLPPKFSKRRRAEARKRDKPLAVLAMFGMVGFVFTLYLVGTSINLPDSVILILAFLLPIGFIIWRSR